MKTRRIFLSCFMLILVMVSTVFPAFAAGTPPPLSIGSEPQAAVERLVKDGSVWVSLPEPIDMEGAVNYRKTVQAYIDAISVESETPKVKMTIWKKTDDNRAQMILENTADASSFTEEELEKMSGEAGSTVAGINEYIRNHLSYDVKAATKNKDDLTLSSPQLVAKKSLTAGKAVCQGYANLFSVLANQAGIETVKVRGYIGNAFHVMNVVRTDEGLMAVDVTLNDSWNKDWALLIPMKTYCEKLSFSPIIDPEVAFSLKYDN